MVSFTLASHSSSELSGSSSGSDTSAWQGSLEHELRSSGGSLSASPSHVSIVVLVRVGGNFGEKPGRAVGGVAEGEPIG